jgi:hypothetical protein
MALANNKKTMVDTDAPIITFFFLCLSTIVPNNMLEIVTSSI